MTVNTEIRRAHWTGERIARLGFLVGLGWDATRIAQDPIIASTTNNVHRQSQRFGLSFLTARVSRRTDQLRIASSKRGITVEELIDRLLSEIEAFPNLVDNILDDDSGHEPLQMSALEID